MRRKMPLGVALFALLNSLTACRNLVCSSGVHLSLARCGEESEGEVSCALADSGERGGPLVSLL